MISYLWVILFILSFVCAIFTGRLPEVSIAATKGAAEAVSLCISITGIMCLWSGVMELISASGLASKISKLLMPLLKPLFGEASRDKEAMETVSANITANILGLSNAATPIGLRAADRLYHICGKKGTPDALLTLVIINTASIQLIPTTVAAVRASYGASNPYDIMPAVWGASILSVAAAIISSRIFRRKWD